VATRAAASDRDVEQGKIMHSFGLKTNGKFFAFVRGEQLVLKLSASRVRELIADGAGAPFDAGKGKPMREWVVTAPDSEQICSAYVEEARAFVAAGEAS
jgi:hypothetical protein